MAASEAPSCPTSRLRSATFSDATRMKPAARLGCSPRVGRRRAQPSGQNAVAGCGRSRKRRARPHSSRRDHGLLRSRAARLHRRQRGSRHHDPHRRLVGLSRRAGCRPRSPCHRSDRRPCGAAVDPPRLLQPEDLGLSTTVCARNTCRPISTNSLSVSIAVAPATPLSPRSSASAS